MSFEDSVDAAASQHPLYMQSKAEVLLWLKPRLKLSCILDSFIFTVGQWYQNSDIVLSNITHTFPQGFLVVRSSALDEDVLNGSNAGRYDSVLNVPSANKEYLQKAIEKVISGYDDNYNHQVFIQSQLSDVTLAGVISSRLVNSGKPYYTLSYEGSGETTNVTSGQGDEKTIYIRHGNSERLEDRIQRVLDATIEIESLLGEVPVQIEFAMSGKGRVVVFQVRPLTVFDTAKVNIEEGVITSLKREISAGVSECQALPAVPGLLGMMPDWNPVELLGSHPKPLAVSLYRTLISSHVWCETRAELGYKNIGSVDFLHVLAGRPYVDVRASFNSFLPGGLGSDIEIPLLKAWLGRLCDMPSFHDSIEFDVVQTCINFTFRQDFDDRYIDMIDKSGVSRYFSALHSVTTKVIGLSLDSLLMRQRTALMEMQAFIVANVSSIDSMAPLILKAISDGSRPFSFIARQAFVAESLLRSSQERGALSVERVNRFRSSLSTVSRRYSVDQRRFASGDLSPDQFYSSYGHLRPNSFDISSPCYRDRFWEKNFENPPVDTLQLQPFVLSGKERRALSQLLMEHQYDHMDPERLLEFMASAICGREESKFIFSAFLSRLLESIAEWGEQHDLSRDELSYLSVGDIENAMKRKSIAGMRVSLENIIHLARKKYNNEKNVLLSPLIRAKSDVDYFWHIENTPHYIGRSVVEACTHRVDHTTTPKVALQNSIVLIECADPGFDWIFTHGISGLITAYGGPNSHMAVRAAEFGVPAALGCGEMQFQRITRMQYIGLDCINKRLYVPDSAMPLTTAGSDQCGWV